MKKIFVWLTGFCLLAGLPVAVLAAEVVLPSADNPSVIIGAAQSHKNLYIVGRNLTVNGNIAGDLTAAGGNIVVTGNIEQEALIAGGALDITGSIGSHARLAGGNVSVSGKVAGDLVVAGGNVSVTGQNGVGGDVLIAGGNVLLDTPVGGQVKIAGGNVTVNGKIGGDVSVQASRSLVFGPNAEVLGRVHYTGPVPAVVQNGARVGEIVFTQIPESSFRNQIAGILSLLFLIKLLAVMIAGFLLVRFFKDPVAKIVEGVRSKPWESLAWGLLGLVAIPLIAVLLLVVLVGFYAAVILGLVYLLALALSKVLSVVVLGFWLLQYFHKPGEALVDWQAILIGAVVAALLAVIPILGWLVLAVLFLMTLGAILKLAKENFKTS